MASPDTGPIPPLPSQITIPTFSVKTKQTGTMQVPASNAFFYAGIQSIWLWWLVDLKLLTEYLEPFGVTPYEFGNKKGAVNVNFFNSTSFYGTGQQGNPGIGGFNETELNVVGYATKVGKLVPQGIPLQTFLAWGEQTKRVGNFRLWVACDDAVAVAFGQQQYFENKFLVSYEYNVPSPNNPAVTTWSWQCYDSVTAKSWIYNANVDLDGQVPASSNMSEWIDLSFDSATRRPVASRRDYFGTYDTYMLKNGADVVQLGIGNSKHPMRKDLDKLIGTHPAVAVQHFASPTVIGEASAYYADL
jgi:hypothetical protein